MLLVLWEHMRYPELIDRENVLDPNDDFFHFRTNAAHLVSKVRVPHLVQFRMHSAKHKDAQSNSPLISGLDLRKIFGR